MSSLRGIELRECHQYKMCVCVCVSASTVTAVWPVDSEDSAGTLNVSSLRGVELRETVEQTLKKLTNG